MRDNQPIAGRGNPADLHGLGKSANAAHVRLKHIKLPTVRKIEKLEMRVLPLAGGDLHRRVLVEQCIPLQIVDVDRCFNKIQVVPRNSLDNALPRRASGQAYATSTMSTRSGPVADGSPPRSPQSRRRSLASRYGCKAR